MTLQGNHNVRARLFGMLALMLLAVLTVPSWTLGTVAVEGVQEPNEGATKGAQETNVEAVITGSLGICLIVELISASLPLSSESS